MRKKILFSGILLASSLLMFSTANAMEDEGNSSKIVRKNLQPETVIYDDFCGALTLTGAQLKQCEALDILVTNHGDFQISNWWLENPEKDMRAEAHMAPLLKGVLDELYTGRNYGAAKNFRLEQNNDNFHMLTFVKITASQSFLEHYQPQFKLNPTGLAQSVTEDERGIKVVTDKNNHASYMLESNRFDVAVGQKVKVTYKIIVEEDGIMSLGFLNTTRNGWYGDELILRAGNYQDVYEREIPAGETQTSLVFRNYQGILEGGPGQTTFTIQAIDLKIE